MTIRNYIRTARIGDGAEGRSFAARLAPANTLRLDALPGAVTVGSTLVDLSRIPWPEVRRGVSLSLLFADRVAAADPDATDPDRRLASLEGSLGRLGFRLSGGAPVRSVLRRSGVSVHRAIVPFLTVALGGAGAAPVVLALLEKLEAMDAGRAWIELFHSESRRFRVHEFSIGTASATALETEVRIATVRLDIASDVAQVLFFRLGREQAEVATRTSTFAASNSLMAVAAPDIEARLRGLVTDYIWDATIG